MRVRVRVRVRGEGEGEGPAMMAHVEPKSGGGGADAGREMLLGWQAAGTVMQRESVLECVGPDEANRETTCCSLGILRLLSLQG